MTGEKVILLGLALVFVGLLFLPPSVFQGVAHVFNFGFRSAENIPTENISVLQVSVHPYAEKNMLVADVYSRYPFNFKNELLADAGASDNVKNGGAAIFDGVLIGKIIEVKDRTAVIQTVFDPSFSLPVRIGKSKTDALLIGGVEPRLTMIPKNADIAPGDLVYSASANFEYGLLVGTAGTPTISGTNVFSEAPLILGYNPLDIRYLSLESK
ncbi:MAG: Uncharacterized protein LiPW15_57 [Parcubacteria group bacterium LiPW_15]|nr:MAG: Uncharacterized protein LiPW15_57 [Parcubacteria group bacterium LiPW_15]